MGYSLAVSESRLLELGDHYLGEYLEKIRHCLGLLTEEQIWWRPSRGSNSVGNLILHLCGNLSQWILAGLGGAAYERQRSQEFAAESGHSQEELLAQLTQVVEACRRLCRRLASRELAVRRTIQGYDVDGWQALFHAVEHMSYHTGQIVYITKQLVGDEVEIEFYPQHRGE